MSRTKNSAINITASIVGQLFGVAISFVTRIFFIRALGSEYLGLNGLFTNILTVLSLAELGVGSAITYSLYEPLAKKDQKKCLMLMQLYKKIYAVIGVAITVIGISITPLLPFLINDIPAIENINLIYLLFVLNTATSYFFSYKRNLIIADQKRYIATIYRYGVYFLLNVAQIIYLLIAKDYIGFLIIQIISTLLENILVSRRANKMYSFLTNKEKIPLDKDTKKDIIKNTKALMMHKVGGTIVSSTDNILLSSLVSLNAVGLYSNYYMVINGLNLFLTQIYNSIIPSIGNLWSTSNNEKKIAIFKKVNFMSFWIFCFVCTTLLCVYNDFIELWVGKEYLFPIDIVIILVINFYLTSMRKPVIAFRDASGLFYKDRWKSIIESIINLIASIALASNFGTLGVFIGTFISSITTCVWVEPYILYKYGFHISPKQYFVDYAKKTILFTIICLIFYVLCSAIKIPSLLLALVVKIAVCIIGINIIMILIYRKNDEYKFFCKKIEFCYKKYLKNKKTSPHK